MSVQPSRAGVEDVAPSSSLKHVTNARRPERPQPGRSGDRRRSSGRPARRPGGCAIGQRRSWRAPVPTGVRAPARAGQAPPTERCLGVRWWWRRKRSWLQGRQGVPTQHRASNQLPRSPSCPAFGFRCSHLQVDLCRYTIKIDACWRSVHVAVPSVSVEGRRQLGRWRRLPSTARWRWRALAPSSSCWAERPAGEPGRGSGRGRS